MRFGIKDRVGQFGCNADTIEGIDQDDIGTCCVRTDEGRCVSAVDAKPFVVVGYAERVAKGDDVRIDFDGRNLAARLVAVTEFGQRTSPQPEKQQALGARIK